jgi:hypothetical protein
LKPGFRNYLFHPNLENAALPQDSWILKAAEELLAY